MDAKVIKCPNCGANVNPGAYACEYCGTKFRVAGYLNDVIPCLVWDENSAVSIVRASREFDIGQLERFLGNVPGIALAESGNDPHVEMLKRHMLEAMIPALIDNMELYVSENIERMTYTVQARIRAVKPGEKF